MYSTPHIIAILTLAHCINPNGTHGHSPLPSNTLYFWLKNT